MKEETNWKNQDDIWKNRWLKNRENGSGKKPEGNMQEICE